MADIRLKLLAEMENVETILAHLPGTEKLSVLSDLELAGVAALLHSFYNGVENMLKQIAMEKGVQIPDGPTWHKDLLNAAVGAGIVSSKTRSGLADYLAFRHFFSHGYAVDLDLERLEPLVANVSSTYSAFKNDLKSALLLNG